MSVNVPTPGAAFKDELIATAQRIATRGKGILASDESPGTCEKRLSAIGLECTDENQRKYRELLYTTEGLGEHISGAIMYEATLYQKTADGKLFVDVLNEQGVIPGIKVDKGLKPLPGSNTDEKWTRGLDDLAERCQKYYEAGARFAKWRNILTISESNPSELAIFDCCQTLAKYAAICQTAGLVPIVEPEIMLDGDHTIEKAQALHEKVWSLQYSLLQQYGVLLEGSLLKPSMIVPGADRPKEAPERVAQVTADTLLRTVPAAVPGIVFLSGGQSEEEATLHIQAMNVYKPVPWSLSFSFGRALQASVLKTWNGKDENIKAGQDMLRAIAQANGQAQLGKYDAARGHPSTTGTLYVANYTY